VDILRLSPLPFDWSFKEYVPIELLALIALTYPVEPVDNHSAAAANPGSPEFLLMRISEVVKKLLELPAGIEIKYACKKPKSNETVEFGINGIGVVVTPFITLTSVITLDVSA
jgi:hypothetical protein